METFQELKELVKKAEDILKGRPELYEKSEIEILKELNNKDMIRIRWMILAKKILMTLDDFSEDILAVKLSKIEAKSLTQRYIGFLLIYEKKINIIKLLILAEQKKIYISMIPYVESNIIFFEEYNRAEFEEILIISQKYKDYEFFMNKMVEYINKQNAENDIFDFFINNSNEKYYRFICKLFIKIYFKNINNVNIFINNLISSNESIKMIMAIKCIESVMPNSLELSFEYFDKIDGLLDSEEKDFWNELIPLYIMIYRELINEKYIESKDIYTKIVQRLRAVVNKNIVTKRIYIESIMFFEKEDDLLYEIMDLILQENINQDRIIFQYLDKIIYNEFRIENLKKIISKLEKIYTVNNYNINYQDFFDNFDLTRSTLKTHQNQLCEYVLDKIARGNKDQFYFALGLFLSAVDTDSICENNIKIVFTEDDLLTILEGIALFSIDAKVTCNLSFKLYSLTDKRMPSYENFMFKFICLNYPKTIVNFAEKYVDEKSGLVSTFAKDTLNFMKDIQKKEDESFDIPDLKPNLDRINAYTKIQFLQQKEINNKANEKSIFSSLFKTRKMKYGKKNGIIQIGVDNELIFHESGYNEISVEYELPRFFIEDPIYAGNMRLNFINKKGI